ncbi:tetratricopeptide repeat protein [Niabella drilacis]|uniref:tetratricopeptide repeat protein n=1 Tax=Niabella drilacis (strain DSM 25811 / CCM 8410 / CCUG 62505 / LMG 26954 / E90) TaxID=1285928 RepID=UPI001FDFAE4D|nr:tetratricopeptide repeat protein [Niabella drilacis]
MKKPQVITIVVAAVAIVLLLAFGRTVPKAGPKPVAGETTQDHDHAGHEDAAGGFSIDTVLAMSKKELPAGQALRLDLLEKSITRGDVKKQRLDVYHQLAHFWKDTAKAFIPYAWFTAESARLENSEKSLNFAAQIFLNQLSQVENEPTRHWMAEQAKDLFEKTLSVNPANDSAQVGLGATYLYGGIGTPMEGIGKIRAVVEKDSTNVYAQMTLATASLMSGQQQKAQERLETVLKLQPQNIQAILMLGDLYEKDGNKDQAIQWYSKAVKLVQRADIRTELEKRIEALKK